MAAAFAYLVLTGGINANTNYTYTETRGPCRFNSKNAKVLLSSFVTLPTANETTLMNTLAAVGPIAVRFL